ncbi:MAG: tRNA (adenosine(37)-N6)-dimethylallyltransferase MiaA [Patescibacteria group bacterium]
MKKAKVLVMVGPNASGKSDLAVRLAKKFNGEIISADSRQVYKGLDIGSGKITKKEMAGVRHHLLDVAGPKTRFSADDFKRLGQEALRLIIVKRKLPIIVGGTGFYIDVLTGKVLLPDVPPNKLLRGKLNKLSKEKLFEMLKKRDPARAKTIDKHNKVRLVRALEIVKALGKVPTLGHPMSKWSPYSFVYIGLSPHNSEKRIHARLLKRLPRIIRECRKLHKQGLSYKRMHELGLEYRFTSMYLKGEIVKKELMEKLNIAIRQYAKRQMTWFKRNKKIKWFNPNETSKIIKYLRNAHYFYDTMYDNAKDI